MMRKDPVVEEVRKVREEHAAKFNYDLDAIYRDLQRQEEQDLWPHKARSPIM